MGDSMKGAAASWDEEETEELPVVRADRYPCVVAVEVDADDQHFSAMTRNLSLGGFFLETERVLTIAAAIRVRFKLATSTITATGSVRWVEHSESHVVGYGIRLDGMRASSVYLLCRFFNEQEIQ
jgi:hypothetical protein